MIGTCKFCGQTKDFPQTDDEAVASAAATAECACAGAKNLREMAEKIDTAQNRVYELFGSDCENYGFIPAEDPSVIDTLCHLVEDVGYGRIDSASLEIRGIGKASIKLTNKGRISVERKATKVLRLEG